MKKLKENSVDAIVTDPPYALGFMGKAWDTYDTTVNKGSFKIGTGSHPQGYVGCDLNGFQKFCNKWAKECLRILKPGGFLLSFGGTRTYHRMVCGIEDAGFEIRDTISWFYCSGFPKSLNIGKAIDKIKGNEREVVGIDKARISTKDSHEGYKRPSHNIDTFNITKGTTEWEGWGTALKPSQELIVVARKPLSEKTVALNVLKWGTGGINIDATRIGDEEIKTQGRDKFKGKGIYGKYDTCKESYHQGRFPANTILDVEAGKMLDEQSGISKSIPHLHNHNETPSNIFNPKGETFSKFADKGGASRFFYCPKASKSERNEGMDSLKAKQMYKQDNSPQSMEIFGTTDGGRQPRKNNHPTVKPIKLMEYLIKLVSKEGAIILDPFLGSGTTAIAALKLNRKFIGIEKEKDYIKICKARVKYWEEALKLRGV